MHAFGKREAQMLVDITFSHFAKMSQEEVAAWVALQLAECGFPTEPLCGSWGVMKG